MRSASRSSAVPTPAPSRRSPSVAARPAAPRGWFWPAAWSGAAACALVVLVSALLMLQGPPRPTEAGPLQARASDFLPVAAPERWYAPLPHNGAVTQLSAWWGQHGDPILLELIEAAQATSPNLISAASRVRQAQPARDQKRRAR